MKYASEAIRYPNLLIFLRVFLCQASNSKYDGPAQSGSLSIPNLLTDAFLILETKFSVIDRGLSSCNRESSTQQ
jgi:hypothetical protein